MVTAAPGPTGNGWILIERAGDWGSQPAASSGLLPAALRTAAQRCGLRLQFVRRAGPRPAPGRFTCLLVSGPAAGPGTVEERLLRDPSELLDADLDALATGGSPGFGTPVVGAVYLVCTQAKVNRRCLEAGQPVAAALRAAGARQVWETSHVGGCRFAANVVCLPAGVRYLWVAPGDAAALVAATEAGGPLPLTALPRASAPYSSSVWW